MTCVKGETVLVQDVLSREDLIDRGFPLMKSVFKAKSLKQNGVLYRLKMNVALESSMSREDNMPLFGRIIEIIVVNSEVFLKTRLFRCLCLDPDVNAYKVTMSQDNDHMFLPVSRLAHWKPVSLWKLPCKNMRRLFISARHIIV